MKIVTLSLFLFASVVASALPAPSNEVIAALAGSSDFQTLAQEQSFDQLAVKVVPRQTDLEGICGSAVFSKSATILSVTLVRSWDNATRHYYYVTPESPADLQRCR